MSPQLWQESETSEFWQSVAFSIVVQVMDKRNADATQTSHAETEAQRLDRLAWEAEGIAEARAELNAGLYVNADKMRAWINSLRTDMPLPPPPIRRL